MGEFVKVDQGGSCTEHNAIIANIRNIIPNSYTINSSGLPQRGEGLNFLLLFIENWEKDIANCFLFKKFRRLIKDFIIIIYYFYITINYISVIYFFTHIKIEKCLIDNYLKK